MNKRGARAMSPNKSLHPRPLNSAVRRPIEGDAMPVSFEPTFKRLRTILQEQQANFSVKSDTATLFSLEAPVGPATIKAWGGKARAPSIPVAWIEVKKNYVSYHLMGIYMNPKLEAKLSNSLRAHMQGKSCFNFKQVDETLLQELGKVTAESLVALKEGGFVGAAPVAKQIVAVVRES
jgi:hypothetical protein